jgi:DNA-binding winged helix-turn-helix (wHTH) protein
MPDSKPSGVEQRRRRRWVFADCVFDEANWALVVAGQRVPVETKPLELLRELLGRAGDLVSKEELLDRIWPDVTVVEASLTTAIHKLRHALGDEHRSPHIIETVPRIGYRLSIPVEVEGSETAPRLSWANSGELRPAVPAAAAKKRPPWTLSPPLLSVSGGLLIAVLVAALSLGPGQYVSATRTTGAAPGLTQRDAANALRKLDVGTIERMLAAGWSPNTPFDNEGNAAINYVLGMCEWDRGHNQEQMVLMVRTLIDGGARLDHRNVWGDTPYSIAKAIRYCGPNHPVTQSIRTMCFAGYRPYGDRCLASYEIARR